MVYRKSSQNYPLNPFREVHKYLFLHRASPPWFTVFPHSHLWPSLRGQHGGCWWWGVTGRGREITPDRFQLLSKTLKSSQASGCGHLSPQDPRAGGTGLQDPGHCGLQKKKHWVSSGCGHLSAQHPELVAYMKSWVPSPEPHKPGMMRTA